MGRHVVTALLILLLPAGAVAQEEPPPGRTIITGASGISWEEGDRTVMFLTGGVSVNRADVTLQAARAMVWKRAKSGEAFDEIYAEGNVIFTRGTQRLRAERLYYSLKDKDNPKAIIIDLRLQGMSEEIRTSFYVQASEARMAGGEVQADNIKLSSCPYAVPHYHLEVGKGTLTGRERREVKKGDLVPWPFDDFQVRIQDVMPELGGAPIFFFPVLVLGSWVKNFPLRSIRYGNSSRFGHTILSEFGHRIQKADGEGKSRSWGDLTAEADWRQERGGAGGLGLDYKWGGYEGLIDTYYLHDRGRDPDLSFNSKFPPLEHDHRGKAHLFHRHDFAEQWRYEIEAYYLSDRSLLEEFFEREFKESKEPESAAYVRWLNGPMGAYVYERHRLNDFQTQNEFLPRVTFDLISWPVLLDNLYLSQRADMVHIRRRFDEDLHLETKETWRFDSVSEVSLPWDLGIFQISPFAQNRMTFYEDDLEGESELRALWTAGGRIVAQIHATHPAIALEGVGMRGLRHVAELELRYAATADTNVERADLFPFEEVDQRGEFEEVAFELRQRFLTRNEKGRPSEFLSITAAVEYYPDSERDTISANVNNFQPPFNWIPVTPGGPNNTFERRLWSNLHYDALLRPGNLLSISLAGEYNSESRHEEVREAGVAVSPIYGLSTSVTQTFVRGVTDAWTGGAAWALTEKWTVSLDGQYDFRTDDFLRQKAVLARDFHDFLVEAVYERDFGRDEDRFLIAFVPKFLGKSGLRRSRQYRAGAIGPP